MPDRCEVLPGDSVVARRGGALLWVDRPARPPSSRPCTPASGCRAPVPTACCPPSRSGGLARPRGGVVRPRLADPPARCRALAGKGQPAVDGVPVSGSSVEGGTLASGFSLGQSLYVGPGGAATPMSPGVAFDLVEGTVPGCRPLPADRRRGAAVSAAVPPAPALPAASFYAAGRTSAFGSSRERRPQPGSGEQTAFWRPERRGAGAAVRRRHGRHRRRGPRARAPSRQPRDGDQWSARAVPIADTQNVLSSAHAALQRNGREVSLVDLGSLNGTHVAGPEATEWTQLEPGVAHPLSDGDRLLLGWTVITFEQPAE